MPKLVVASGLEVLMEKVQDAPNELVELQAAHQALEARLGSLTEQKWLTAEDRLEEVRLKKEKLRLKDRMLRLHRA